MLRASELAAMRSTAGAALPDTAVIERQTWNSDQGGGGSLSWTPSGTVDCRLAPIFGVENVRGGAISPDATYTATLPSAATVDETDRLIINAGTYSITGVRKHSWNLTTRVEVKQV